ncbi:hypothetical protein [Papillibacter cinnamivorans]|uniref:Uncharacterized protein n=1 Tax=Papillibacter cinnamivorans DSM 12816 TaxID=1122930 RepID=A0A1W1ZR11_9FIRM|nr:hypothetical protein [Papillibacter cinnamivorans]SMC50787.1 hypothetical protein SAMN02745168_1304 [Papillibacter cinnamivorans DSM 12816]
MTTRTAPSSVFSLTGSFTSVQIRADVTVNAVGAAITNLAVSGGTATVNVDASSHVGTLTANVSVTVNNSGTITTAVVNADNVVVDGNRPSSIQVNDAVTVAPVDGNGNSLVTTPISGGGDYTPVVTLGNVSVSKIASGSLLDTMPGYAAAQAG